MLVTKWFTLSTLSKRVKPRIDAQFIRSSGLQTRRYVGIPSRHSAETGFGASRIATVASIPCLAPFLEQEINNGKRSHGVDPPGPQGELNEQSNYDNER